ncbi:unnamed protein product [Porites lobata]|uniref:Uncharacterized protein n=1 Tax=Porites lobata TaxID=104759 RepID=A0ABN8RCY7_9CNID|nr:unnamed protein product [Porites lobata]
MLLMWSPRGYTSLVVPGHDIDLPQDITIFMDIALNPGLSSSESLAGASSMIASFLVEQRSDFDPVIAVSLPTKGGLWIMHINVCSLRNEPDFIRILLLKCSIDILALTETWLGETWNDVELTVPGYNLFHSSRKSNVQSRPFADGGVIIHACDGLAGNPRRDLESDELEEICLKLKQH